MLKLLRRGSKDFHYRIDWRAFLTALIGTPLIWTGIFALIFAVSLDPEAAIIAAWAAAIGGVPYLLIGAPILYLYYKRSLGDVPGTAWRCAAIAGGASILASIVVIIISEIATNMPRGRTWLLDLLIGMSTITGVSVVLGYLWGGTFGFIYGRMRAQSSRELVLPQNELLERFD